MYFEMTMNSKHRTEQLKTKNEKDIETRKIKSKGEKTERIDRTCILT